MVTSMPTSKTTPRKRTPVPIEIHHANRPGPQAVTEALRVLIKAGQRLRAEAADASESER